MVCGRKEKGLKRPLYSLEVEGNMGQGGRNRKQRAPETLSESLEVTEKGLPCQIRKLQGGLGESFPLVRIALGCNSLSRKIIFTRSATSLELKSLGQCFPDMRLRICPRTKCGNFFTSFQRKSVYQK